MTRVILKPGGVAALLLATAALGYFAVRGDTGNVANNVPSPNANVRIGTTTWGGMPGGGASIQNGDFNSNFVPARFFGIAPAPQDKPIEMKARVSGEIADPWVDNSNWAEITAEYSREYETDGNSYQSVRLKRVKSGRLQMVQFVQLHPGETYRLTCRLRAKEPTPASLGFIPLDGGESPQHYVTINRKWQTVEYTVTLPKAKYLLAIGLPQEGAVVHIDDVSVQPANLRP